jgi:hypothetical protein
VEARAQVRPGPGLVVLKRLSRAAKWTIRNVCVRQLQNYSAAEIGHELGMSDNDVRARVAAVRLEIATGDEHLLSSRVHQDSFNTLPLVARFQRDTPPFTGGLGAQTASLGDADEGT